MRFRTILLAVAFVTTLPHYVFSSSIIGVGSITVSPGATFNLPVSITGVSDLYAFQFDVSYDPLVVQLMSINEGPFLPSAGTTSFVPGIIDNVAGLATFTADTIIGFGPGVSGSGVLATLQFNMLSGSSALALSNVILLDSSFQDITFQAQPGSISTIPEPSTFCLCLAGVALLGVTRRVLKWRLQSVTHKSSAHSIAGLGLMHFMALGVVISLAAIASPVAAGQTVIDFEGQPDRAAITTQFSVQGVTFSSATILRLGSSLNPNFPPFSGLTVVYDWPGGIVTATFDPVRAANVRKVSARITGNRNVTLTAFNSSGVMLGSSSTGGANYSGVGSPNILLAVESQTDPIAKVAFNDGGNTFTIDDFTFETFGCTTNLITQDIAWSATCGPEAIITPSWGNLGSTNLLRDNLNRTLQLSCSRFGNYLEFSLDFTDANGTSTRVGRCPWLGGRNNATITYTGASTTGTCIAGTFWRSREPSLIECLVCWPQGEVFEIDWKTFTFNANTNTLTLRHFASLDGPGGLIPDRLIKEAINIDPGSFNPNLPQGIDPLLMVYQPINPCDINQDGVCDEQDKALITSLLGQCIGSQTYNELADANHDGCINLADRKLLFQVPGDLDQNGIVDCTDLAIVRLSFGKRAGQPGFDPRADTNADNVIDVRDLSFVAQKLPRGTVCR